MKTNKKINNAFVCLCKPFPKAQCKGLSVAVVNSVHAFILLYSHLAPGLKSSHWPAPLPTVSSFCSAKETEEQRLVGTWNRHFPLDLSLVDCCGLINMHLLISQCLLADPSMQGTQGLVKPPWWKSGKCSLEWVGKTRVYLSSTSCLTVLTLFCSDNPTRFRV